MSQDRLLRGSLVANAVFSFTSGALLTLLPSVIGTLIEFPHEVVLQVVGLSLLAYSGVLIYLAIDSKASMQLAVIATLADLFWVAVTLAIAAFAPSLFSATGWWIVGGVAVIVLGFSVAQAIGIDRAFRHPDLQRRGWSRVCIEVETDTPADALWSVLRDAGTIHQYAPFLSSSTIVESSASDLPVRECRDHCGRCWREAIHMDDEQMVMELEFQADRPDFPFPFREMIGGWRVEWRGVGSRVRVWWDVVPISRPISVLLLPALTANALRTFPTVIANMSNAANGRENGSEPISSRRERRPVGLC